MSRYLCLPCGYIYDEKAEDNDGDKAFEHKPINWVCPECGAKKFDFEVLQEG